MYIVCIHVRVSWRGACLCVNVCVHISYSTPSCCHHPPILSPSTGPQREHRLPSIRLPLRDHHVSSDCCKEQSSCKLSLKTARLLSVTTSLLATLYAVLPQNLGYAPDFVQSMGMLVKQIKAKGKHLEMCGLQFPTN